MKYWMQLVKTCSQKNLKTHLTQCFTKCFRQCYSGTFGSIIWLWLSINGLSSISITCSCWMTLVSGEKALNFLKNLISTASCNNTFYSICPSVCLSIRQSICPSCLSFHLSVSFLRNWLISFFWKLPWC